ncbi:hypothetical protein TrLO_g9692 [Triparma laevis f. longispina]|uniref:Uncharacterized protein n=1 Tax=Triparma laevis f. longispina TaxID=1714387 RepID=A0A9W7FH76_9STRA|nr:hypothetical protein TrLO_g9692 [Triparma laevis f. longispina]
MNGHKQKAAQIMSIIERENDRMENSNKHKCGFPGCTVYAAEIRILSRPDYDTLNALENLLNFTAFMDITTDSSCGTNVPSPPCAIKTSNPECFALRDIITSIETADIISRRQSNWFGGFDCHQCCYGGMSYSERIGGLVGYLEFLGAFERLRVSCMGEKGKFVVYMMKKVFVTLFVTLFL